MEKSKYKSEPLTQGKPRQSVTASELAEVGTLQETRIPRQGAKRIPGPGSEELGQIAAGLVAASQTDNKVRDYQSTRPDHLSRKAK